MAFIVTSSLCVVASCRRSTCNALKRSLTPSFCLFRRSELLLLMDARDREAGGSEVSREKGGKHFVLARGCCQAKAMEGPWEIYPGLAARPASGWFLPSSFFTEPFYSALFPVTLGGLTANASLDCLCFADVFVGRWILNVVCR